MFFTVCSIQLANYHLFWVFWFESQKFPEIIIYFLLFCFSQILPCFAPLEFSNSCACFLFVKTFCQSWEIVANVENLCFQQRLSRISLLLALTALISLWWVSYEESFQVCKGRWWKNIQDFQELKLGDAPSTPKKYSRRLKCLSLGMPRASPSSSTIISSSFSSLYFYCFTCHVLCLERLALYFSVFYFSFVFWS